jgi:predicted TIM-barrel fold metal-dependent hydrolase
MTTVDVPRRPRRATGLIDCDVHTQLPSLAHLSRHLAQRWHPLLDQLPRAALPEMGLRPAPDFYRQDTFPQTGPPGSDFELLREQLLEPFGVSRAVLAPFEIVLFPQQGELARALLAALNDSTEQDWLSRDERLYGAITVPFEDGAGAAREIERRASNPRFVSVLVTVATREPLGDAKYWPLFEAAEAHGLPVSVHVAGWAGTEGCSGWPIYHAERHGTWPQAFAAQMVSLVSAGVFSRFPGLQIVLEEAGIAWVAPLMWRLDRAWEAMRNEVPQLDRRPSEIIREHFWFTTQPLDEPEHPHQLAQMLDHLSMDERILFASDYPHWDFDDPTRVLPAATVGRRRREMIMTENALEVFRFPTS